jgi:predicted kinase
MQGIFNPMDKRIKVTIMLGLPGSGKTTKAKAMAEADPVLIRVSKDDIRALMGGVYSPEKEMVVRKAWLCLIEEAIAEGFSVVIDDAGSLNPKTMAQIEECLKVAGALEHLKGNVLSWGTDHSCLEVPLQDCIDRDAARTEGMVGEEVIMSFYDRFIRVAEPEEVPTGACTDGFCPIGKG